MTPQEFTDTAVYKLGTVIDGIRYIPDGQDVDCDDYAWTRKSAALQLRLANGIPCTHNGWMDLDAGILYRIGSNERVTKKRRTPRLDPPATSRTCASMGTGWGNLGG